MRLDIVEGRSIYKKDELQFDHASMPASGEEDASAGYGSPHRRKMHETPEHPTLLKAPTLLMILCRYPELQSSFASPVL